ncbi:hypothetical protein NC661_16250 [Aquibacillus koreensis]|uniref:Uncharacterized protein n=1 Tax=Aquibacillus koreensis TaxID=279446 RepID=A0A9X4AL10_9BACI|nr:hypothetical protein [Aquibacillus koreensis]MCT2536941.1 hypothetical protein [Aquibacillus koreensis]MDC3421928.1 hypothetical protein [Aquibacillus koreensis]
MYIVIGIVFASILFILLLVDKFAPYSEIMSSFSKKSFKYTVTGLTLATVASLGYGIYFQLTYQLPFLDVKINGKDYTVFGDIGEMGYYADHLVMEDENVTVHLVSWEGLDQDNNNEIPFVIHYPSGKKVEWTSTVSKVEATNINQLQEAFGINEIYQLEPYTFKESGDVKISVESGSDFVIEVKEN